ncbi:Rho guanine nucleotide exchange factor gef2 [Grifola frondosa]|uniref:Rho guanine nucleotide exchange factor gef2 n=1 Tax=Grifola frondosa TaxID=5627 RepID=A0A1C7LZT2_GRIFR|nr:Rho guanine nucleotide exchange factor gef2 [Grifola frondosa]
MALSRSPRKVVPLASGDDCSSRPRTKSVTGSTVVRRAFFCGVVVEGSEKGISEDVQNLLTSLGESLDLVEPSSTSEESLSQMEPHSYGKADFSKLADQINELVVTERSYVQRLSMLKVNYADPLCGFSKDKNTLIVGPYQSNTMFGNVRNLLPVNKAFLEDLELLNSVNGPGVGDVARRHFKELSGFEHYKYFYAKREEALTIFTRRIKYSSPDTNNRLGLRELLMEPVQRIPRYTLMFGNMIKLMDPRDPQRASLLEADEVASRIALAEMNEEGKRGVMLYTLGNSIDGFPPALVSNSRRFVDCIDVEDVIASDLLTSISSGQSVRLQCSLVLLDDKLVIAKRPGSGEKTGRMLAGLDHAERDIKVGGQLKGGKKNGMVYKGVVDITDIVATDVGGVGIHIYFENPPQDQTDRWSGRPFRAFSVVIPPSLIDLEPARAEGEKKRFLNNLWEAQAKYRTKAGQSVVLCANEKEVENKAGKVTLARTYFNIFQRTSFLQEPKKTRIVLHIDPSGSADPIPFGMGGPPFVVVRVHPMAGQLSRYTVTSSDPDEEVEEDIMQTHRVKERIVQTIHQYGLFMFHTGRASVPSTPTASSRARANKFGLDALSRNISRVRPTSAMGDIFGGSINNHKRSKTVASRASTLTQTASTADSSLTRFSRSRSNSITTAATSIAPTDDDPPMSVSAGSVRARSISRAKKLIRRGKSPISAGSSSEPEAQQKRWGARSRSTSRAQTPPSETEQSDFDIENEAEETALMIGGSERDLDRQLLIARKNSHVQRGQSSTERPISETIYEGMRFFFFRNYALTVCTVLPEISQDAMSQRSTTPRPHSTTPTKDDDPKLSPRQSRSLMVDRRPMGPRTPSPLPSRSPQLLSTHTLASVDTDLGLEATLVNMTQPHLSPTRTPVSPLPRSRRQPFEPTVNKHAMPSGSAVEAPRPPVTTEPLLVRKKGSVRTTSGESPSGARRVYNARRNSALGKQAFHGGSPRRVPSGQARMSRIPIFADNSAAIDDVDRLVRLAETTKEDVESCRRAVKRIKLETDKLQSLSPDCRASEEFVRPTPIKALRIPQRDTPPPATKEAQARMEDMHKQISTRRQVESGTRARSQSVVESPPPTQRPFNSPKRVEDVTRSIRDVVSQADKDLERAASNQEIIHTDLKKVTDHLKEKSAELDKTRVELQNSKRQCEVVKSLLTDCTRQLDIIYDVSREAGPMALRLTSFESFNEELDSMYNDATLPEDEAWGAMVRDLRQSKQANKTVMKENSHLKRRIAELEMQQEQWGALLRTHGLIP